MVQSIRRRESLRPSLIGLIAIALLALAILELPSTTAALLIGGIFLSLALLYRPVLALYLLIFAIPFGSLLPFSITGANVTAADLLLLLTFVLWFARGIAQRRLQLPRVPLVLPLIIFILAAGLSLTVALSLTAALKELSKWLELLLAYVLVVSLVKDEVQLRRMLGAILLAGLAEAAIGFYQFFFRVGPEGFLLFGGSNLRAFGTFEQPNPYAGYLGLIIPLAFGAASGMLLSFIAQFRRARSGPARRTSQRIDFDFLRHKQASSSRPLLPGLARVALWFLAVVALGAMLAALFFSLSRGAWLGVAVALISAAIIRSRRAATLVALFTALIVIIVLLGQLNVIPDVVSERFASVGDYFAFTDVRGVTVNDANFAIVERMAHWQAAWNMFLDHPWLGVGIGNYAEVYPAYALPHWADPLGHAHNYYLNVLAESGAVGLSAYLLLWAAIFVMAWRTVRATHGVRQAIAAGAFGVLVALSIHNLFDNLFVHSMHIQVGITLGLVQHLENLA